MKNTEIIVPILNNTYKVIICWGDDNFIKKVFKAWHYPDGVELLTEYTRGRTYEHHNPNLHPIIILPKEPRTADEIGTLAHEAVHAINAIYRYIRQENVDEVFAHSVGAVVRQVLINNKVKYEYDK